MPMQDYRTAKRDAMRMADEAIPKPKKSAAPEPLPERAPARGLEAHGFSKAEERAIRRSADGGTPRTDTPPKSAQDMLDRLQRGKGY